jgi:hypothetical protein
MRKPLFLLPGLALLLLLLGCRENTFRVYYHGNGATAGKAPVDSEIYTDGYRATVKGPGNLKKKGYNFFGWKYSNYRDTYYYNPGDRIDVSKDINLYAVWDDGSDSLFSFILEDGEVTVTGITEGTFYSVVIPDTLQGKNVTCIDDIAFGNLSITEVRLPKYLKRIGAGAFAGNRITGITIPDSVETIGPGAFRNNSLVSIELGPNVDIRDDTAFGKYGSQFRTFYNIKGKTAGLYQYNDTDDAWE